MVVEHRTAEKIPVQKVSSNIEHPRNNSPNRVVEHRTIELFHCFSEYLQKVVLVLVLHMSFGCAGMDGDKQADKVAAEAVRRSDEDRVRAW